MSSQQSTQDNNLATEADKGETTAVSNDQEIESENEDDLSSLSEPVPLRPKEI